MTDEQIIKALECCIADKMMCDKCPIQYECVSIPIDAIMAKYALDLITRRQVEIKRLQTEIKRYKRYYYNHEYDKWEKEIKSEAVKEFQKNLKALYTDELITDDMHCPVAVIKANIDDIAEELVGEEE